MLWNDVAVEHTARPNYVNVGCLVSRLFLDRLDFQFRLSGLRLIREKCNEVLVFHIRLLDVALRVPRVADGKLGTRYIVRIRMATDKTFPEYATQQTWICS